MLIIGVLLVRAQVNIYHTYTIKPMLRKAILDKLSSHERVTETG